VKKKSISSELLDVDGSERFLDDRDYSEFGTSKGLGLDFAEYLETLFYHKKLIIGCFLGSLILGWFALLLLPRTYASEAKLNMRVGRESVGLDPSATTSPTLTMQKTQEEEVNSALELLNSRTLCELIVDEIGVAAVLDGRLPNPDGKTNASGNSFGITSIISNAMDGLLTLSGVRDPIGDRERAITKLGSSIQTHAPKKSTSLSLSARAKTPAMAQAIVQSLSKHFIDRHVQSSITDGSLEFFTAESLQAETKLNELLETRATLMKQNQLASIDSRREMLTKQQSEVETHLLAALANRKEAEARIADLKELVPKTPVDVLATIQTQSDPTFTSMRSTLYNAEIEEIRLRSIYSAEHPKLQQAVKQVVSAKQVMDGVEGTREITSTTPNPVRIKLDEDLQKSQTSLLGLDALILETEKQLIGKQEEIKRLLTLEVELGQLDREINAARSSFGLLRDKHEEARVLNDIQLQRISNIGEIQKANFIEKPVSPNKELICAATILLACSSGIGLVLLREMGRKTLRTPSQTERSLDYPVVATVNKNAHLSSIRRIASSDRLQDVCSSFHTAATELLLCNGSATAKRGNIVGIIGPQDGCGASSLAICLARMCSEEAGLVTTLMDFDLAKRSISKAFHLSDTPGFADIRTGEISIEDFTKSVDKQSLNLIPSSSKKTSRNFRPDLSVLGQLVKELREENDVVIVDLPPANRPNRTLAIAHYVDQVVIVIESDKSTHSEVKRLCRQLESGGVEVLGFVVNKYQDCLPRLVRSLMS